MQPHFFFSRQWVVQMSLLFQHSTVDVVNETNHHFVHVFINWLSIDECSSQRCVCPRIRSCWLDTCHSAMLHDIFFVTLLCYHCWVSLYWCCTVMHCRAQRCHELYYAAFCISL